ncbi:uncharacterized protein Z520_00908 [Fonsecaea multimorphosa CBS 102226]|uniref:Mitochondrial distribution and morphology protein 10 n=1 Tax=Fonsecaea multimorphosa CBS 102226 TaxID=1442371 RepID=A0A0D2KL46_9EURO|nr:uncharacterized protein Z520_00908 [Fonsecaea multimorphosa CBS 102226]KIY04215.1 hypothetical protein Z520_00908 [Fonsecaea multimorphosa CBS 102226]OAL32041.1 hypothetical protein AYO22_00911 [Fonsecaea multimorphosa]
MIGFMDYIVHAFGTSTDWNPDNSYSSLTATSDALLSFQTPSTLSLHVSSLSTPNFASSYTLSTLGHIDGSISYLYSSIPLGHVPSEAPTIPLRYLTPGYRDIRLPLAFPPGQKKGIPKFLSEDGRKPILLHATLDLPPPSVLTALYARRISPETLLSVSLYSKSASTPVLNSGPPPASVLAHIQHDAGRYSIEGLGSTDNGLLGVRGLWNFGLSPPKTPEVSLSTPAPSLQVAGATDGFTEFPSPGLNSPPQADALTAYQNRLASKPSLLSAGAEFYYSPLSHVIGLSTGLRFTTLTPHITPSEPPPQPTPSPNKPLAGTSAAILSTASHAILTPSNVPHSSFPYTMTLTLTPLTGSISSTYSVRPTSALSLSSRFDFNFYSWESRYVVGGELWRPRRRRNSSSRDLENDPSGTGSDNETNGDPIQWARTLAKDWFSPAERSLKEQRIEREEENVLNFRVDDSWNVKALWTGRVKSLLVEVGVSVSPVSGAAAATGGLGTTSEASAGTGSGKKSTAGHPGSGFAYDGGGVKKWTGKVGVSVVYST